MSEKSRPNKKEESDVINLYECGKRLIVNVATICSMPCSLGSKLRRTYGAKMASSLRSTRHSTFEPQIIPKRSTKSAMLEQAILSLYAKGMTTRDIQATLQDLYHVDVSPSLISKVTTCETFPSCCKILLLLLLISFAHWGGDFLGFRLRSRQY